MILHVQVLLETLQSSIADIDSVEESEEKEEHKDRNDMDIELPEETLLGGAIDFGESI
jgi:hypothetical protein